MSRLQVLAALVCLPALAAAQAPSVDLAMQRLYNFDFRGAHEILDRAGRRRSPGSAPRGIPRFGVPLL